jgi:Lar family restriction alleviation protein
MNTKTNNAAGEGRVPRLVVPLPCPFCGSAAVLDYDDEDRKLAIKPFYKCSDSEKCGVFGPDGATEAEALDRWNQRTRCDFCREIPLTPTEREHMESIRHNVESSYA